MQSSQHIVTSLDWLKRYRTRGVVPVSSLQPYEAEGPSVEFQYFFAQREALETIVYLHDVVGVKDKYDLIRFDSSGAVSAGMFDETWRRYVVKMATGSGKTKVLSLALAWSFFNRRGKERAFLRCLWRRRQWRRLWPQT